MLKDITTKVKAIIELKPEVSPRAYNDIFNNIAMEMGVEHTDMESFGLGASFDRHYEELETNTSQAIAAINTHDTESLEKIQVNMDNLKKEIATLKALVYKDELTKVFNRKYITDKITLDDKFISSGFMVMLDMNNLKYINDNIGHVVGDKAIVFLAKELLKISKKTIRYGGDEFLLFMDENTLEDCYIKLASLRDKIATKVFLYQGHEFSLSFAFAVIGYDETKSFKETLEIADAEMYKDKERTKALLAKYKKKS